MKLAREGRSVTVASLRLLTAIRRNGMCLDRPEVLSSSLARHPRFPFAAVQSLASQVKVAETTLTGVATAASTEAGEMPKEDSATHASRSSVVTMMTVVRMDHVLKKVWVILASARRNGGKRHIVDRW